MSLKSSIVPPIPEETARVARAAFPTGNVVMQLRDTLGNIYTDDLFTDLFPTRGQPAEARLPFSSGHDFPIYGELDGSTGRRCCTRSTSL